MQGDHSAAGCGELLPQKGVVVVECGNGGGGGVQAALESGALAGLLGELASQLTDFLVPASLSGGCAAVLSEVLIPLGEDGLSPGSWWPD
jgi:hypothetical protein